MRNAVLPSVPSQIYNFGNNEVQITNLDVSMDARNVYGSSFCLDFRVDGNQLSGESFAIPHQQYQSDCQFTSSSWEHNTQQSLLLSKKAIVSQDLYTTTRKRSTEIVTSGLTDLIENGTAFGEWKKNKRRKASSSEEQWLDHQVKGSAIIKEHKTDTASVLQEASLYIKILQEQIQANAASGIAVHDDCKLKFLELKAKRTYRFIVFKIEEKQKQVIVEKLGEPTNSYEDFTASLPADECRYAVYDFDYVTDENCQKSRIVFIAWSPDTSKVRSKMIYASSKDRFKRELDGIQVELQATDPTEMGLDVIRSRSN
ncbi:hypothetical protein GH714_010057 [Hevea brasiliensis]|uniref:ADF-H domain-containing protein n=1 Tax=Hevea brasiliensis TaxID=3981 RepID=A0A6A6N285_HEVBR|nr:hypothetical protein GH714_010057 [Hevea brasiliensis]